MMKKALGSSLIRSSCWPSRSAKLTVPQRCVKTMAYAKGDEGPIFSHEAIPTPRRNSMPILGTTLDIIAAGSAKKFHEYVNRRHTELGPIFREHIGPLECIFLSSPEMMREVFVYEGKHPRHPIPEAWILYQQEHKNKRGLLFMDGQEWLHYRKVMNSIMLARDVESMNQPISAASQNLITKWINQVKNAETEIQNLEFELYKWSIETLVNLMLGSSHVDKDQNLLNMIDEFSSEVHKIFKYSARMFIAPPKLLKLIKSKVWTEFEEVVARTLELGHEITDYCLQMDLQNGYLVEMRKGNMSHEYMNRIFVDMIIAAGDTTAFSTLWALTLLGKNSKIQQEIRCILKDNPDNKESTLMKGVIRETLRMFPVAPFIGRVLPEDSVIGNYKINKNTMVLLSFFTSGRDEANFKEPNTFCPHRWDRKSVHNSMTIKPQASMPFALGARSCIGQRIANKQMNTFLSDMIANFELSLGNEKEIEPILQMVTVPNQPIQLKLKLAKDQ